MNYFLELDKIIQDILSNISDFNIFTIRHAPNQGVNNIIHEIYRVLIHGEIPCLRIEQSVLGEPLDSITKAINYYNSSCQNSNYEINTMVSTRISIARIASKAIAALTPTPDFSDTLDDIFNLLKNKHNKRLSGYTQAEQNIIFQLRKIKNQERKRLIMLLHNPTKCDRATMQLLYQIRFDTNLNDINDFVIITHMDNNSISYDNNISWLHELPNTKYYFVPSFQLEDLIYYNSQHMNTIYDKSVLQKVYHTFLGQFDIIKSFCQYGFDFIYTLNNDNLGEKERLYFSISTLVKSFNDHTLETFLNVLSIMGLVFNQDEIDYMTSDLVETQDYLEKAIKNYFIEIVNNHSQTYRFMSDLTRRYFEEQGNKKAFYVKYVNFLKEYWSDNYYLRAIYMRKAQLNKHDINEIYLLALIQKLRNREALPYNMELAAQLTRDSILSEFYQNMMESYACTDLMKAIRMVLQSSESIPNLVDCEKQYQILLLYTRLNYDLTKISYYTQKLHVLFAKIDSNEIELIARIGGLLISCYSNKLNQLEKATTIYDHIIDCLKQSININKIRYEHILNRRVRMIKSLIEVEIKTYKAYIYFDKYKFDSLFNLKQFYITAVNYLGILVVTNKLKDAKLADEAIEEILLAYPEFDFPNIEKYLGNKLLLSYFSQEAEQTLQMWKKLHNYMEETNGNSIVIHNALSCIGYTLESYEPAQYSSNKIASMLSSEAGFNPLYYYVYKSNQVVTEIMNDNREAAHIYLDQFRGLEIPAYYSHGERECISHRNHILEDLLYRTEFVQYHDIRQHFLTHELYNHKDIWGFYSNPFLLIESKFLSE